MWGTHRAPLAQQTIRPCGTLEASSFRTPTLLHDRGLKLNTRYPETRFIKRLTSFHQRPARHSFCSQQFFTTISHQLSVLRWALIPPHIRYNKQHTLLVPPSAADRITYHPLCPVCASRLIHSSLPCYFLSYRRTHLASSVEKELPLRIILCSHPLSHSSKHHKLSRTQHFIRLAMSSEPYCLFSAVSSI